jgi:hypothetical protein
VQRFPSGTLGRGKIAVWFRSLSPQDQIKYVRNAGKHRWDKASPYDRARARMQLQPYRISRSEALRRLRIARNVLAHKRHAEFVNGGFLKSWEKRPKLK